MAIEATRVECQVQNIINRLRSIPANDGIEEYLLSLRPDDEYKIIIGDFNMRERLFRLFLMEADRSVKPTAPKNCLNQKGELVWRELLEQSRNR